MISESSMPAHRGTRANPISGALTKEELKAIEILEGMKTGAFTEEDLRALRESVLGGKSAAVKPRELNWLTPGSVTINDKLIIDQILDDNVNPGARVAEQIIVAELLKKGLGIPEKFLERFFQYHSYIGFTRIPAGGSKGGNIATIVRKGTKAISEMPIVKPETTANLVLIRFENREEAVEELCKEGLFLEAANVRNEHLRKKAPLESESSV